MHILNYIFHNIKRINLYVDPFAVFAIVGSVMN